MSEVQTIIIDGKSYNAEDISERCRNMLVLVQQTNQSISVLAPLIESARAVLIQSYQTLKTSGTSTLKRQR